MYLRRDIKHNFEMQLTKFKKYFNLKDEKNEKIFTPEEKILKMLNSEILPFSAVELFVKTCSVNHCG
jgi:hypothetical protein